MNLKEGAKYIRIKTSGKVYAWDPTLATHPEAVEFVHETKKAAPAPRRAPAAPPSPHAPATSQLPDADPALLEELNGLTDLDDPEGDPDS